MSVNSSLSLQDNMQRGLSLRTISFVGLLIFLMSIGEGMVAPAIPLYGNELGASYSQLGFFMTGYSIAYTLMAVTAGFISDKIGRKRVLLFSIVLSVAASLGYYFAATPTTLLCFRTLEGMSRGILWPVAEAIIADNTAKEMRSKVMGRFTAAYGLGSIIGTLSGGYIMQNVRLTAVFPFYPLIGIVVLVTSLYGITDHSDKKLMHHGALKLSTTETNHLREMKKIWPVCLAGFAYAGFLYSIWGLLPKIADHAGALPQQIGLIFACFWGARVVSFAACGEAAAVWGRKKVLLTGISFMILSTAVFFVANSFWHLMIAAAAGGIGTGIMFTITITLVADLITSEFHGFGMGFLEFCMGLGMIVNTTLSGIIGEKVGINYTYLFVCFAGVITFITTLLYIPADQIKIKQNLKEDKKWI